MVFEWSCAEQCTAAAHRRNPTQEDMDDLKSYVYRDHGGYGLPLIATFEKHEDALAYARGKVTSCHGMRVIMHDPKYMGKTMKTMTIFEYKETT